jgi:hypothetical protein
MYVPGSSHFTYWLAFSVNPTYKTIHSSPPHMTQKKRVFKNGKKVS